MTDIKCIVKDCENHTHQGGFVGELCVPCHEFITEGKGKHSQVFRNTVLTEREECAKEIKSEICDEIEDEAYCILVTLLSRIRARGGNDSN